MNDPQGAKFLTAKDVQERFQISNSALYRWINKGIFPTPLVVGKTRRFDKKAIEAFEKEYTGKAA